MTPKEPGPQTTLVILLGASEWPKSPDFKKSKAFSNAAYKVKDYFLRKEKFGLRTDNLLDLFDSDLSSDEIDERIRLFLDERISELAAAHGSATDVIVYFVGHGGFTDGHDDYYLAIRRTRADSPGPSGIAISSLANTIKQKARYIRRHIILDCCFAASAFQAFQSSSPTHVATKQALDAFTEPGIGIGLPTRGTSLLCSSRHNSPSLLSPHEESTMFSEALTHVLENGHPKQQERLSLRSVCLLAKDFLLDAYGVNAPKPEVHSPDQSEGDVAFVPMFPNLARVVTTSPESEYQHRASVAEPSAQSDRNIRDVGASDRVGVASATKSDIAAEASLDVTGYIAYGDRLFSLERWVAAEAEYGQAIQLEDDNPNWHHRLGAALYNSKKYREAEDAFRRAVELEPDNPEWRARLGSALYSQGRMKEAESEYQKAVRHRPKNVKWRVALASTLLDQKKWVRAIVNYEAVLSRDPTNPTAIYGLSAARRMRKQVTERAKTLGTWLGSILFGLALILGVILLIRKC